MSYEVAISTPVHTDVALSIRQLDNYSHYFGENFLYMMHLSKDAQQYRTEYKRQIGNRNNVILLDYSYPTDIYCTLGAHLATTNYLLKSKINPKYFYIHSSSDLLFKSGLEQHINNTSEGVSFYKLSSASDWAWGNMALSDRKFQELLLSAGLSIDNIFFGRVEGSYMTYPRWLTIYRFVSCMYSNNEFFNDEHSPWPLDECIIPTFYVNLFSRAASRIVIETKRENGIESRVNPVTVEDIGLFNSMPGIFGAKWFSMDPRDSLTMALCSGRFNINDL